MASVLKIGAGWRAQIRKPGRKSISKTFKTKAQAVEWARVREGDLDIGMVRADPGVTVGQLIKGYRELRDVARPISDKANEHYMLNRLDGYFGGRKAAAVSVNDLVEFCKARRKSDPPAGPYAVNMDISKLGTVYRYASAALHITLPDPVAAARPLLNHLGLIGGGGKRERVPTDDELERIVERLPKRYADMVEFAAITALRRGELVRIVWADVDEEHRMILVRDRKDPRQKKGNDQWVPLLDRAWDVLQRQDKTATRIFPLHEQTVSKYFKRVCDVLGIPDLHFHDLRHKAVTEMFRQGYQIQEVALVSGHKDWRNLRRYTNLRPEDLRRRGGPAATAPHLPPATAVDPIPEGLPTVGVDAALQTGGSG